MLTGVTATNVARATRGTCTRGRKDASAPGFVVAVSGMNQRIAASTTEKTSNTTKTSCSGAGAKSASRESGESRKAIKKRRAFLVGIEDYRSQGRDRHACREPLQGTCDDQRGRRAGRHKEDHGQDVQRQSGQNRRATPDIVRERSHREQRKKKAQDIGREDHRDHERR